MKMKWIMGNKREVREGMKESYKRHMGGGLIFTGSFAELDEFSVSDKLGLSRSCS